MNHAPTQKMAEYFPSEDNQRPELCKVSKDGSGDLKVVQQVLPSFPRIVCSSTVKVIETTVNYANSILACQPTLREPPLSSPFGGHIVLFTFCKKT